MGVPIFVLAGQSNAAAMHQGIIAALDERFGTNNYALVTSFTAGAPLVYQRPGLDWQRVEEMPTNLADTIISAVQDAEDSYLAGMIWIQGEADTYPIAPAQNYSQEFLDMLSDVSGLLDQGLGPGHGFDDMDIVISQLSENAPAATDRDHWQTVIDQQSLLADDPNIQTIDPDDVASEHDVPNDEMFRDHLHYGDAFMQDLSAQLVAALPDVGDQNTGAPQPDRFEGTANDDIYLIDHALDQILEPRGSDGDLVQTFVDFSLRDHSQRLENLSLLGEEDLRGVGNGRDNVMTGNAGDNKLFGMWGDDMLDGGAGRDQMDGGHGDDVFVVDHKGDRLIERAHQGHDLVQTKVDISLRQHSQHLEDLDLLGVSDLRVTGNGRANVIAGNSGDNRIDGAWGRDTIDGGEGNDTLVGGRHGDLFQFGENSGHDVIRDFELGLDHLQLADHTTGADATAASGSFIDGHDLFLDLGDGRSIKMLNIVDDDIGTTPQDYADILFV